MEYIESSNSYIWTPRQQIEPVVVTPTPPSWPWKYWVWWAVDILWDNPANRWSKVNTRDNAGVPTATDDVFFYSLWFGANDCSITTTASCKSIDFTWYTNRLMWVESTLNVYWNATFYSWMNMTKIWEVQLSTRANCLLKTWWKVLWNLTKLGWWTTTLTLWDNLNISWQIDMLWGIFDASWYSITADSGLFEWGTIIFWPYIYTFNGRISDSFYMDASANFTHWNSTIKLNMTGSVLSRFHTWGKTYYDVIIFWIPQNTGRSTRFRWGGTFNSITDLINTEHFLMFTESVTTTVWNLIISWSAANLVKLQSCINLWWPATNPATLTKSWWGNITINYANIKYITWTPINTWYATNSTDWWNNTNISFI